MVVRREPFKIQIRDPIHGTLQLSRNEVAVVDHGAYQRLRMIKQLGLADLAFPGATHTRYAHGLGTMHIASRMFRILVKGYDLAEADELRLLQTLRLAAMFHDLGHAPLSHTTEAFMPQAGALDLGPWLEGRPDRLASHEDYTLKIIIGSELTKLIEERFADVGVRPEDVATLIAGRAPLPGLEDRFRVGGRNWLPLLRQCVSSELDADRMDYLLRDSYFAGVPYGRYDHEWLLENLLPVERDGALYLGLNARALFGFEDYLLSRYHMFMSVYFHHIPIGYEVMLKCFHEEATGELVIPAAVEGYLGCDDVFLFSMLRASRSSWARRIVERKAYRMLVETREVVGERDTLSRPTAQVEQVQAALQERGISSQLHSVKGRLSKYFNQGASQPPHAQKSPELYLVDEGHADPVETHVPLYQRYSGAIHLKRVYVDPARIDEAREVLRKLT